METAAQVIVDAARAHGVELAGDELERVATPGRIVGPAAQQEGEVHGGGKLGRAAEAAVLVVGGAREVGRGLFEQCRAVGAAVAGLAQAVERRDHGLPLVFDLGAPLGK